MCKNRQGMPTNYRNIHPLTWPEGSSTIQSSDNSSIQSVSIHEYKETLRLNQTVEICQTKTQK